MVDVDRKTNVISSDMPNKSPRLSSNKLGISNPSPPPPSVGVAELLPASDSACSAYEHYLRLPELKKLWSSKEFPGWQNESVIKPALQGLELTFRFIPTVLFDQRPYSNRREWKRKLESLATRQVEIIALLCEEHAGENNQDNETRGSPPIMESKTSEASLLPKLATWQITKDVAQKILYTIDCEMRKCPYTLGLGETNVTRKPSLNYDLICKPLKLHALKQSQVNIQNYENQTLYTTHQLLETWIYISKQLLDKLVFTISLKDYEKAASHCWLLEKIWKLFTDIEDLHLCMDPDDFLRLKNELSIKAKAEKFKNEFFCFRSTGLVEITKLSKDLRHKVPEILESVVDPRGGPRIQEAAMRLYRRKEGYERVHLLQALQAVEMAVKSFYYSYKQLLVIVMGSLEANGNKGFGMVDSGNLLDQIFLEPTYYPSLDAAKTFLGYYWSHECELTRFRLGGEE